ncbi:nitroreductase family deazaflavin-dependent oxidoreductase [Agromyces sp. H66]|uniref:nitroreductase family deazaflavin-dependent oxidoreductase n=1 Tax=Agromyces sp. H66 TaxID=2529859 RepID=UPI0010AAC97D|nr:nitroreductase family deazaflavin-dependent oxidoreductase [Agromyces sp. H66]
MSLQSATVAGALFMGFAAIAAIFVLAIRAKSPLVLDPLIRFQRAIVNPRQLRSAGRPGATASVIRHRGRVTGRPYETPVAAVVADDGFLIPLPYGTRTQWLKNVLAGGSAVIVHEGGTFAVDRPEVIGIPAAPFTASERRIHRWFGVDRCLRVRRAGSDGAGAGADAAGASSTPRRGTPHVR